MTRGTWELNLRARHHYIVYILETGARVGLIKRPDENTQIHKTLPYFHLCPSILLKSQKSLLYRKTKLVAFVELDAVHGILMVTLQPI